MKNIIVAVEKINADLKICNDVVERKRKERKNLINKMRFFAKREGRSFPIEFVGQNGDVMLVFASGGVFKKSEF